MCVLCRLSANSSANGGTNMARVGVKHAQGPGNRNESEVSKNGTPSKKPDLSHGLFAQRQRYRETLETTDRREAIQRERDLIAQAKEGKLASKTEALARVLLPEAFDRYLKERELEISNARHEWDCS